MWRSKPLSLKIWSRKWNAVYWIRLLFGRTLKHCHVNHFEESLTSYLQDIHASHFQTQEKDEVSKTRDIYTPTLKGQLTLFGHESVFSKMSGDTSAVVSLKSSSRWKDWVTQCVGEYSARRKQAQAIREKEFLFSQWKTPTTEDSSDREFARNSRGEPKLSAQAKWPTATSNMMTGAGTQGRKGGMNLQTAVNWPTPTFGGNNSGSLQEWGGAKNPLRNPDNFNTNGNMQELSKGRLNPLWVCQLMGTTFEKTFFVHLEIPSTPTPPNSHSEP